MHGLYVKPLSSRRLLQWSCYGFSFLYFRHNSKGNPIKNIGPQIEITIGNKKNLNKILSSLCQNFRHTLA
jgi:hypothetical protein